MRHIDRCRCTRDWRTRLAVIVCHEPAMPKITTSRISTRSTEIILDLIGRNYQTVDHDELRRLDRYHGRLISEKEKASDDVEVVQARIHAH